MSQFYTIEQMNALGTFLGEELNQTRSTLPNPALNYDSFILALDKAIEDGEEGGDLLCIPTSLSFIPKVTLPVNKDRVILRFNLEVNGISTVNGTDYNNNPSDIYQDLRIDRANIDFYTSLNETDFNTPEQIAEYLFLDYMGLQRNFRGHLKFDPENTLGSLAPLSLDGYDFGELEQEFGKDMSKVITKADVKLTLMLIDNLPADGIDFVLEQWGEEKVVQGCGYFEDSPFVNT